MVRGLLYEEQEGSIPSKRNMSNHKRRVCNLCRKYKILLRFGRCERCDRIERKKNPEFFDLHPKFQEIVRQDYFKNRKGFRGGVLEHYEENKEKFLKVIRDG